MTLNEFIEQIGQNSSLDFEDTMSVISQYYDYTPSGFQNGELFNEAGQNEGSCKIFAFAALNKLSETQTLACFGRFYQDVLNTPEGSDHGNIRNFMSTGWQGIKFDCTVLATKA
ncbi:HopJ type III effector protein [Oceanospirillum sediminis]|uniref:HopJ type III effector protein n=1 Tax=Oceanospirillum sediminis TaxID=2760088 RepID=A0A839IV54_9GAMM|nr:HopJ type III effector protein [Oceanospirillum sediminis]MBB1488550.1 HopJ type III effector protein [Oceanospirillum sediminis]